MATDAKLIRKFECFRQLTGEQVEEIAEISNSICYSAGHVLFEEGEKGEILYLLIDGDVDVFYRNPVTGLEKVDTVSSEEVIGCSAMVPPYVYTATEKTRSDVEVLEIKADALRDIIQKDPDIGLKIQEHIIKILNDRILALRHRAFSK
jgi:CRP/FNR family transcriptional regulator